MLTINSPKVIVMNPPMPDVVHELVTQFKDLWWACDTDLPPLGPVYSPEEKQSREAQLAYCLNGLTAELERLPQTPLERQATQERAVALLSDFAIAAFGMEERHLAALGSYGLIEATQEFVAQARRFDPALSAADIFQASRNAWSMNFMQLLIGLPVAVTPAVLAYSLLYPYSDNYLDDPRISSGAKAAFSLRFRQRLEGEPATPANAHEQKIFDLVEMIEGQFPRWCYPEVYDSLLAIYYAQTNSLRLLRPKASPYEMDVLGIVFEKGGASVLADGYLVAGTLTPAQREFMFYYGTFTQLMDDLEDVAEDLRAGIMTVFSQTAQHWPLDAVANRTIHFGQRVLDALDRFETPGLEPLKEMMRLAITPLLIDTIGQHGRLYTRGYLKQLEAHFPFRFGFVKAQRKRLARRKVSIDGLIEKLLPG